MHIRLNTFDYNALTAALLAIVGEDTLLTTELIASTLTGLIEKIDGAHPTLPDDLPYEIVKVVNDKLTGIEQELLSPDEIWSNISDALYVAGQIPHGNRGDLWDAFAAKFGVAEDDEGAVIQMDSSQGIQLLNDAYAYLDKCRGQYMSPEEYLIKSALYDQLLDSELMQVKFRVLDIPGFTVRYGNNLITFPVILAEVL